MTSAASWMRWLRPLRPGAFERRAVVAEEIEPRILYSADLAAGLGLVPGFAGLAEQRVLAGGGEYATDAVVPASASAGTAASRAVQPASEIAFVDMSVPHAEDLVSDLQAQRQAGRPIEIVRIGADEDGLARITATLAGRSDVGAVHVLSHGADGMVQIGAARLDAGTLDERAGEIGRWGRAFTADGDLLLYGCDVAASAAGQRFLAVIGALTGADVAASADLTGAAALGGNWVMEARTGPIEAATAIDLRAQSAWQGVLAAPTVTAIADQTTPEDTAKSISFTVGVTGAPLNSLVVTATSSDAALLAPGGIVLGGNGGNRTLALTPVAGASGGPVTVTVDVSDGTQVASTSFRLTVTPVNDAPSGADKTVTIVEDTPYTFTTADFGASDVNDAPPNALLAVKFTTLPAAGTLANNGVAVGLGASVGAADIAAGRLVFTPGLNGNGAAYAVFTFQVQDDGGTANGGIDLDPVARTFTFDVTAVNDGPPVNAMLAGQTTDEDRALQFKTPRGNAIIVSDVDGGPLTTTVSTSNGTLFAPASPRTGIVGNGTSSVTISGLAADINVVLDGMRLNAVRDYNGVATLTVTTSDGSVSTTDSIDVAIAPVADIVADAATTKEDTPVTINVLGNDTFENAAPAITMVQGTAIAEGGPAVAVANGSVALVAGRLVFTPQAGFVGAVPTFSYTVTSGGVDETGSVDVTVTGAAPPVVTVPGVQTMDEDTTRVFGTATGNAIGVADADSAALTATVSASNGILTAQAFAGATITGNGSAVVTISGTAAAINGALEGLSYTAAADYNGHATLTVAASDGALSNSTSVAIGITAVADITDDSVGTSEDAALNFNALAGSNGATADSFEDPGRTVTEVTQGAHGTVSFTAAGELTYVPAADYNGADSFSYTVTSGTVTETATVNVTVSAVNDAPVAVDDNLVATEDTPVTFTAADLLGNDTDIDTAHSALAIASVTSGAGGTAVLNADGTVTFTPSANFNGTADFTYTVGDGALASAAATASVAVAAVNDAPVAVGDTLAATEDTPVTFTAADLLGNDTDVEGSALTIASVTSGAGGTAVLNADGTVTFTPSANFNGTADFTYQVSDGALTSAAATASVAVGAVDDAPVAAGDALAATEDTPVTFTAADLLGNDTDIDTPHAALAIASVTSGAGGTAVLNGDGSVTFTPNANFNGAADFTYKVSDGTLTSAVATASVAVAAVDDAPVAVGDTLAASEDTPVTFTAAALLGNDTDIDTAHPALTIASVTSGAGGTAVLNGDGSVTFTPGGGFTGAADFAYTVTDGSLTSTATATVTVAAAPAVDPAPLPPPPDPSPPPPDPSPPPVVTPPVVTPPVVTPPVVTPPVVTPPVATEPPVVSGPIGAQPPGEPVVQQPAAPTPPETPATPAPAPAPGTTPIVVPAVPPGATLDTATGTTPVAPSVAPPAAPSGAPPAVTPAAAEARAPVASTPTPPAVTRSELGAAAEDLRLASNGLLPSVNPERTLVAFAPPVLNAESFRFVNRVAAEARALESEKEVESALVFARFATSGRADAASPADVQRTLRSAAFSDQLDQLRGDLQQRFELDRTITVSVAGVSLGFSLLYVLWLIRGGVLMGSYLSALPAWRVLDPLPVLSRVGEEIDEDEEALEAGPQAGSDALRGFG